MTHPSPAYFLLFCEGRFAFWDVFVWRKVNNFSGLCRDAGTSKELENGYRKKAYEKGFPVSTNSFVTVIYFEVL